SPHVESPRATGPHAHPHVLHGDRRCGRLSGLRQGLHRQHDRQRRHPGHGARRRPRYPGAAPSPGVRRVHDRRTHRRPRPRPHPQGAWTGRTTGATATAAIGCRALAGLVLAVDPSENHLAGTITTSVLALVMGMQAAAARKIGVADVTTVVVTSTMVGLASE